MAITLDPLWYVFSQSFEKILGPSQVCQYNGSGFTVDPSGFNDAPVGFPSGFAFLKSSHISVYINPFSPSCQLFFVVICFPISILIGFLWKPNQIKETLL
jgi:hypothetical protein